MQGLYLNGRRPKSKKAVKLACDELSKLAVLEQAAANGKATQPAPGVLAAPYITAEATSMFGNEFDGNVKDLPVGHSILFVGPDPYRSRKYYGKLTRVSEVCWKVS